jgi:fatty-acyl-CoA synthase
MAALEVADPDSFDMTEFARYLAAQDDLGSKGVPRLIRLSKNLPVTGSNKVLKRDLQAQRWHCDEPLYRWVGRPQPDDRPTYHRMSGDDRRALDGEIARHGRESLV